MNLITVEEGLPATTPFKPLPPLAAAAPVSFIHGLGKGLKFRRFGGCIFEFEGFRWLSGSDETRL